MRMSHVAALEFKYDGRIPRHELEAARKRDEQERKEREQCNNA